MENMHGSKFKFIYTDWFIKNSQRQPFGNGIHPAIKEFVQYIYKNNLNIVYYKILQYDSKEKGIKIKTNATFTACCLASSEYFSKNTYRVTRIKVKIKTMFSVKKG